MSDWTDVSHEEYQRYVGDDVIPFNFDEGPYDGIKCVDCEVESPESEWDWVDTFVSMKEDEHGPHFDVQGVRVECPECGSQRTYR